jgi:Cellulose binding domain
MFHRPVCPKSGAVGAWTLGRAAVAAAAIVVAIAALGLAGGCGGGAQIRKPDAGAKTDGPTVMDGGGTDSHHGEAPGIALGQPCTDAAKCGSGICVDGVCCNTSCDGACLTCAASGSVGTCVPADIGTNPRNGCTDMGAASCGTDGLCDGTGSCENYAAGVTCQQPGCTGSTLVFAGRCDGVGTCVTPASQSCAPWTCGSTGACKTTCSADADCTAGNFCVSGSCGLKPPGATCGAGGDCKSGFCAQGACCATACTGNCKSCALTGSAGTCTNVPSGQDPQGQCADALAPSCGTNGSCDGAGACQLYPSTTICGTNTCTAGTEILAGKCDGAGVCQAGTTQSCGAYACDTTAVCKTKCAVDADCSSGNFCIATVCGKKATGATCAAGGDCTSGHCEESVCCNTACTGTCMSCALTTSLGTCTPVALGADPLNQCPDVAATNPCGTNGSCNGAGACQFYPAGLNCGAASCTGSTLTQARTCDGAGACRAAMTAMCVPYVCGTAACKTTCTSTADCVSPNVCTNGSCGKNPIGATCAVAGDCGSGFCAQNVCCNSACTGTCQSCALAGSAGTCAPVPAGAAPNPTTQCATTTASTCGTDGLCDGAGACRKYVSGTQCAAATCTGTSFKPPNLCNGTGICGTVTPTTCGGNLICGTNGQCKATCASSADCVAPNLCNTTTGTCGLKGSGTTCGAGAECASGFCQQGVCCSSACTGTCQSCAFGATAGTCTNVPVGQAPNPTSMCSDLGATMCKTNGLCDGTGKCQLYGTTTTCAPAACSVSTLTPARTCDGAGNCKTVTSTLCDPYGCGTTSCKTTCAANTDCATPATCNTTTGSCGKLSQGAACTTAASCASGFCVNSVCCNNACTGICTACNLTGMVGTCTSIPGGSPPNPTTQCTNTGAATCGTNGLCNGSGACQKYASGTSCAAATCTGSSLTGGSTCNASSMCVAPAPTSCNPYICGAGACKTTCATTADCVSPDVCTGTVCSPPATLSAALKAVNIGNVQFITINVHLTNNGTSAIPLTQVTVRYWYTLDGGTATQTPNCDYTFLPGNCSSIVYSASSFVTMTTPKATADHYFQFGFASGAGSLAASGGTTSDMQLRWNKNDFTNFTQTNDYSYNASTTAWVTTTKVTAYLNGALVYGTEP